MPETSTATVEAPVQTSVVNETPAQVAPTIDAKSAAESKRTADLKAVIDAEQIAWARWQVDGKYPDSDRVPPYVSSAIADLADLFGDGLPIPRTYARLSVEVDQLRFAYMDWCRWSEDPDRRKRLYQTHADYVKIRDRQPLVPLPSIQHLHNVEKVSHMQIARMWKLVDVRGEPQVHQVAKELSLPGSVITPEYRQHVEDLREGIPTPKSKAERFEGPRPRPAETKAAPSIETLVIQRVNRNQIVDIKLRERPGADAAAIAAAVDATAAALGITLPVSSAAELADVGQSWIKADRGMEQDTALSMPVSQTPGLPMPLDALNAAVAAEALEKHVDVRDDGPTGTLAERCLHLFQVDGLNYHQIAQKVGRELRGTNDAKRAREVERLINQATAGATDSEEVEG